MALNCPSCRWKFCAYCFQTFEPEAGGPAHDHVGACAFNPGRPDIYPPGEHGASDAAQIEYFETTQRRRVKRAVGGYLQQLQPLSFREAVKAKLSVDLQRLNL